MSSPTAQAPELSTWAAWAPNYEVQVYSQLGRAPPGACQASAPSDGYRHPQPAIAVHSTRHCVGITSRSAPVMAAPPATDGDHLRLKYVPKSAPPGVNFRGAREPVFDLFEVPVGHAPPPARPTALSSCTGISTLGPHHKLLMTTTSQPYKTPKPSPEGSARPARPRKIAATSRRAATRDGDIQPGPVTPPHRVGSASPMLGSGHLYHCTSTVASV